MNTKVDQLIARDVTVQLQVKILAKQVGEVRALVCGEPLSTTLQPVSQIGVIAELNKLTTNVQEIKGVVIKKTPETKRKPGDWKIPHSTDWHILEFLKASRDFIRIFYRWVFEEPHDTTQEGSAPLRNFVVFRGGLEL